MVAIENEVVEQWKKYLSTLETGKTRTINPRNKAYWMDIRREDSGEYTLSAGWPVHETHGDDYGSWLCGCMFQFKPHCHEAAGTYATLDQMLVDGHSKLMQKSGGMVGFHRMR